MRQSTWWRSARLCIEPCGIQVSFVAGKECCAVTVVSKSSSTVWKCGFGFTTNSGYSVSLTQCGQSTANCIAGYYCDGNSLSTTANACPAGQYSLAGLAVCSLCAGGSFGAVPALTSPSCNGNCTAGYYCPPGSVSSTQIPCPTGQFSLSGWSYCKPSPVTPVEFSALIDLFSSTSGTQWSISSGWVDYLSGSDPCTNYWFGINCTATTPNHILYVFQLVN